MGKLYNKRKRAHKVKRAKKKAEQKAILRREIMSRQYADFPRPEKPKPRKFRLWPDVEDIIAINQAAEQRRIEILFRSYR